MIGTIHVKQERIKDLMQDSLFVRSNKIRDVNNKITVLDTPNCIGYYITRHGLYEVLVERKD